MARPVKKHTTYKKKARSKRGTGLKVEGTKKKFQRSYPGEDPKFEEHPEVVADAEVVEPEPTDAASTHKFPPPKRNVLFRKVWMDFIDNICARPNFKSGHLHSLEILCDLHVEYEQLRTFLRKHGRSYKSFGRAGMVWRLYPEVQQLNTVQSQIEKYMKMLGLILKKDHGTSDPGATKDEWA